jgi:hypothetical protein
VWHTATIVLIKDSTVKPDLLASFISKRISNRKSYQKDPLTSGERKMLSAAVAEADYGSLALVEERKDIEHLGRVGSANEEVMLGNRALHQFFFSHVNWTKKEDEKKKIGFYIKTLELPPPAEFMFKIFRHWSIMRILGAIGFNRIVAKQNCAVNASAAAIGALMMTDIEPLDFVKIGKTTERLWLAATALGLSFQPLAGIPFFKLKINGGEGGIFSSREQELIIDVCNEASRIVKADGKHIAFMFRVGRGDVPSAHAIRFPLTEIVEVVQ